MTLVYEGESPPPGSGGAEAGFGTSFLGHLRDVAQGADASASATVAAIAGDAAETLTGRGNAVRLLDAAYRQITGSEMEVSRRVLAERRYDGLIAAVERASGVRLENPALGGYWREAGGSPASGIAETLDVNERQESVFTEKLDELRRSDPRVERAVTDALITFSPEMIVQREDDQFKAELGDATYLGSAIGLLGGGLLSTARSPLQMMGLALGGGAATARTVAGRIAQVALREGALNAGFTALTQPMVQDLRGDLGLEHGAGEALRSIAMAGAAGAAFGGGLEGARSLWHALRPGQRAGLDKALAPEARAADVQVGLKEAGIALPEEEKAVLSQAARVERADGEVLRAAPDGVSPTRHLDALDNAVRRAEGEGLPPDLPAPRRTGVTDEAALAILDREDLHPLDALDLLRRDPAAMESALSSSSPAIREAGAVASLPDGAFALVLDEAVDPRHAALAARAAADPARQAAIVADLAAARPATLAEAREIVLAAQSAQSAPERMAAYAGVAPAELRPDMPAGPRPLPRLPEGVAQVGEGAHGPVLDGLQDRWAEAVSLLAAARHGDARGVLAHPDVPGRIDLVWGDEKGGLRHILFKHPEIVDGLPDLLSRMKVETASANRIVLSTPDHRAVVRLTYDGEAKTWLMTAYEAGERRRRAEGRTERPDTSGADASSAPPASATIAETGGTAKSAPSLFEAVPVAREDGTVAMMPRGAAATLAERDRFLGDLVRSCT